MSLPKYIPVKKKVLYNVRLHEDIINGLNAYADLTGNTTTDVVTNILKEFLDDKVVYNDYLRSVAGKTIKIPVDSTINNKHTLKNYILNDATGLSTAEDGKFKGYGDVDSDIIEIKKIPNNLDKFNGYTYTSGDGGHQGVEFFINTPETQHTKFIYNLYCFNFKVDARGNVKILLLDYLQAINLLGGSDETTKDLLIKCVMELEALDDEYSDNINPNEYDKLYSRFLDIADKYNTGNIIRFGDNIDERIAVNEKEDNLTED